MSGQVRTGQTAFQIISFTLIICFLSLWLLTGVSPVRPAADTSTVSSAQTMQMQAADLKDNIIAVSPKAAGATEKRYVYDANNNKLMYNRVTGMVFSSAGVVYNQDSQPLTYNDKTEEFEDSLKRRLELVENSTGDGLQNYYLMHGNYKVRSVGINDTLYIARIKANTAFNKGAAYDMLVTEVWVKYKLFSDKFLAILGGKYGEFEYFDVNGHKIDFKYFDVETKPNLLAGAGTSYGGGFVKFEKWGTVKNLLEEIVYLMELVPPSGVMGEFALNTVTGGYLRDDRGQKIRIKDNGQLIDPMGWPIIGSDARPLWWKESVWAYTTNTGQLLTYTDEDNILTDEDGFIAHSVISNVVAGLRIYLVYLADETTLIPVTLKTVSTEPYKADYYDLNGNKIELDEIIEPDISVDDRQDNWPEEFPEPDWLRDLKNFFAAIGQGFSEFFSKIGGFFSKYGKWIVIGILIALGLFVLAITMPILAPVLGAFIKAIWRGVVFIVKILVKGIVMIVTAPVKLVKLLISKKDE